MIRILLPVALMAAAEYSVAHAQGNVGIGTTSPDASALLDLNSTSKGLLVPRMTQSQRGFISSPATGDLVFCTDSLTSLTPSTYYYYNGSAWVPIASNYVANYLSISGVLYGPSSIQNTLTAGATPLFNVGYAAASGASVIEAGAKITSDASGATNGTCTGLTVAAKGSGSGTSTALALSSSGGVSDTDIDGTGSNWSVTSAGTLTVGKTNSTTGTVQLANNSSANLTSFQAGNATASVTYTLPPSAPTTSGQVLSSTTSGVLSWQSNNGTSTSFGATGASYITRSTADLTIHSTACVPVPGLSFPIAAGEVWSYRMEVVEASTNNQTSGLYVGISLPSGASLIGEAEGLYDLNANGHEVFKKMTTSCPIGTTVPSSWNGELVGPYNNVQNNDSTSGILLYGTVDNTNGAAGTVQLVFATAGTSIHVIRKNSFVTSWKYALVNTFDQIYTSSTTLVVPSGVSAIYVSGYGGSGGGAGGGAKTAAGSFGAGGGGSGGAGESIPTTGISVNGGETLTITIGAGGSAGTGGTSSGTAALDGDNGTSTTITGSVSGTIFTANGGSGGTHAANVSSTNGVGGAGGSGGSASSTPPGIVGNTGNTGDTGSSALTTAATGGAGPGNANTGGSGGTGFGSPSVTGNGGAGTAGAKGYLELAY
ncbi:MAG TPA: hypothetical protein VGM92_11930 [Candidatus Kapabacteria bacterium]